MRKFYYGNHFKTKNVTGSSVAAWLSETVLRGHGPGATGFESHRRGRIFSKEGTMCVHDFQGTVGWWKEEKHSFDHHREVGRVRIPAGWATHGCCVVCVLYCGGKYPGAQLHHLKKELADRKVSDRPNGERGRLKLLIS
jgi:hypothetical protein